ncbi:hypothetical protein SAMN05192568_11125 [Methylobacterium pseudosasicola]|uniref:Uncharacterized protein n=1 Tax=Methylobacterium pseudosasicola TaxID=582667 RepID=A0A1I4VNQ6_9HYPH|nr:hypothetical protein SAMN05192568_11125 [Methylobacterium pseudosasicola]
MHWAGTASACHGDCRIVRAGGPRRLKRFRMNRRDFAKLMLAAGAAGPMPFGITRAASQTRGGVLNTEI